MTEFNGHTIDLGKWQRLTMREAIRQFWPEEAGAKPALTAFESAPGDAGAAACGDELRWSRRRRDTTQIAPERLCGVEDDPRGSVGGVLRLDQGRAAGQDGLQPI